MARSSDKVRLRDTESKAMWSATYDQVGPLLKRIRLETPKNFKWVKKWEHMTREELVMIVNSKLIGNELPITANIILSLENGKSIYGGRLMRVLQVVRALRLTMRIAR